MTRMQSDASSFGACRVLADRRVQEAARRRGNIRGVETPLWLRRADLLGRNDNEPRTQTDSPFGTRSGRRRRTFTGAPARPPRLVRRIGTEGNHHQAGRLRAPNHRGNGCERDHARRSWNVSSRKASPPNTERRGHSTPSGHDSSAETRRRWQLKESDGEQVAHFRHIGVWNSPKTRVFFDESLG